MNYPRSDLCIGDMTPSDPTAIIIADVGARWGSTEAWFRKVGPAKLLGFEPDAEECAKLNQQAGPNERYYPVALGDRNGSATLYLTAHPACASLYPPSRALLDRYVSLRPLMGPRGTETVRLRRLDDWAADEKVDRIDFLKLDTQGSEYNILRGAERLLRTCVGVEVEVEFHPMYEDQPLFAEVDVLLRTAGFHLWRLDSLTHYMERPNARPTGETLVQYEYFQVKHPHGSGRLMWGNAIYFRDIQETQGRDRDVLAKLLRAVGDADGAAAL
jgi:FkbM family methyltransferase